MRWLYHRHTTMHHNMFDDASMAYDSARDLKWIMLPSWGFAATVAVMSPLLGGLWLIEPNLMWMYLLAQGSYYAVYELLHTASHLPQDHWLAQSRLVKAVSRHHRIHHDRRLMRKFNFNFALPLFDWICGTLYRERHACDDEQDSAHDTERDGAWRDTPAGS
jgi:hypothetical protein